jgi:Protein kinase domain/Sulfatase-modifying factor enzyme 1
MDSARWQRIKELCLRALELPPEQRADFLKQACGGDAELQREVETVLRQQPASGFLDPPFAITPGDEPPPQIEGFEVGRELGRGGMGVVYLARDKELDRLVALKTIPGGALQSEQVLLRFNIEAKALARLDHPAIVPVYRAGTAGGRHYIAMRYVEGQTFAQVLDEWRAQGPLDAEAERRRHERVARILAGVADALEHAHQHQIVHRDVKPGNILLDAQDQPHLTDFGIAKALDSTSITRPGDLGGSYRYMSPEQAHAGKIQIDSRSDVFSLGVVLYEALALRVPFDGETSAQILAAVISRQPRRLRAVAPSVPVPLETICHKALETRPPERYQSAAAMAADLRAFLAGAQILARPPSLARRASRLAWQHRLASVSTALMLALAVVGLLLMRVAAQRRAESCALGLSCVQAGVGVRGQRFDEATGRFGEPEELGRTPVELQLRPGSWWFTIAGENGAFGEAIVFLSAPGELPPLNLQLRAPDGPPEGMVLVPEGDYQLGRPNSTADWSGARTRHLQAFYIDAHEVSNAQYRAYVQASGVDEYPAGWPDPYDARYDDRPVCGIYHSQAERYAAWVGKRLPTADEWEAAARLPSGAARPWTMEQLDALKPPQAVRSLLQDQPELREAYLAASVDVGSRPDLATPAGLYHMFTNVSEFTASISTHIPAATIVKGGDWRQETTGYDATACYPYPEDNGAPTTGFRCARSVAAPVPGRN